MRNGIARNSSSAQLHYALGLSLTRWHRGEDATAQFKNPHDLLAENNTFPYAYALAPKEGGQRAAALRVLAAAIMRHRDDREILFALATFERDADQLAAAREHAARLRADLS